MPKNARKRSSEAPDPPVRRSVYDFLYHDVRRIGSYLAQFDPSGHLLSIKQTTSVEENEQSDAGGSIGGGIGIAKGGTQFSDRVGTASKDAAERTFDPLWTNAVTLLTYLEQHAMLGRSVDRARLGQFVLLKGRLTFWDMNLAKFLWSIPEIRENAVAAERPKWAPGTETQRERELRIIWQVMPGLSYSGQCILVTPQRRLVWASLADASMVGPIADLGLKYGIDIDGEWHMLGVLDALPSSLPVYDGTALRMDSVSDAVRAGLEASPILSEVVRFINAVRAIGRPPTAFGVTPLLIFREVSG